MDILKIKKKYKALLIIILIASLSVSFLAFNDKDFKITKNLDIFMTLFQQVNLYYVDEKDPEDLINASIQGMLEILDPYTTYIPETEMDDFRFMTTGQYGGIGALIRKAGNYTIISEPYEGFPAQRAGLQAGDTIISIDGTSTKGKTVSDVSDMLKGSPDTELNIQLKRDRDSSFTKVFRRENITIHNVPYYSIIDKNTGTGYIRLGNFRVRNLLFSILETIKEDC